MQNRNKGVLIVSLALSLLSFPGSSRAQDIADVYDQLVTLNGNFESLVLAINLLSSAEATTSSTTTSSTTTESTTEEPASALSSLYSSLESYLGGSDVEELLTLIYQSITGATDTSSASDHFPSPQYNVITLLGGAPEIINGHDDRVYNTNSLLQDSLLGVSGAGYDVLQGFSFGNPLGDEFADEGNWPDIGEYKRGARIGIPLLRTLSSGIAVQTTGIADETATTAFMAIGAAKAKSAFMTNMTTLKEDGIYGAFRFRCLNGFNPSISAVPEDPEALLNDAVRGALGCNQVDTLVRADRSLESLIGPLEYTAPTDMVVAPSPSTTMLGVSMSSHTGVLNDYGLYIRFVAYLGGASTAAQQLYGPTFAAAGFCMNISQKAFPEVPTTTTGADVGVANEVAWRESVDNRTVANCWRFFEERVKYPAGSGDSFFKRRHDSQVARCADDYEHRHLISLRDYEDCQANGRSNLRARYDMAYRLDSPEYIAYLNEVGVATRDLLMGMALDAPEQFEQSLLLERQIMTDAMKIDVREPIAKSSDSASMSYTR